MKRLLLLAAICAALTSCAGQPTQGQAKDNPDNLPFRNSALDLDKRVQDLVSRLTTEEKIAQLFNDAPAVERLGIPAYNWWNEALHGVARAGDATVFPQAIGMAATFDENLMLRMATAISDEGRAKHHDFLAKDVNTIYGGLTYWSPNINIFRDPRWGRGQETYGEDPYLTGRMAVNFVRGLQGNDERYLKSVATIKHYAVHSGPEKTRHSDDYHPSPKDLQETYLPAFRTVVKETEVASLMCAYNRVSGKPACGSDELLKDILRGEMGFKGYVVSDCGAISDFYDRKAHDLTLAPAEAAAWALKSGTDLECGDSHLNTFLNLHTALREGLVEMADIDLAVTRLLRARFQLGMFDDPAQVPFSKIPLSVVASQQHLNLSQEAAEKSLVLLKNDGILPLREGIKVAVIGPNATNFEVLVGNYNGTPTQPVLPLQGIVDRAGADKVIYAAGSVMAGDIFKHHQVVPAGNFFHYDTNKKLQPGLKAEYFRGNFRPDRERNLNIPVPSALSRVDSQINFVWKVSPITQKVDDPFAVVWSGVIKPEKTGRYNFGGNVIYKINGEKPAGNPVLEAGKIYEFEARYSAFRWWPINIALEANARLTWVDTDQPLEQQALAAARKAEVVIFMGGIDATLEGEEMPVELDGFTGGDRTHIQLPAPQTKLLKKLKALGKPIVLVNFSGSAIALNWEHDNLNAIVQAFYPGEKSGTAIARVLWGDANPSGRLPVTFYRGVEDLPAFTDYSMQNRTYKYYSGKPLYPFGHGLSYTQFRYAPLVVAKQASGLKVTTEVVNSGGRAGEEVAQLYISLSDAPEPKPLRELKAFQKVQLAPGEKAALEFLLASEQLQYVDKEGKTQNYRGRAAVTVGSGQEGYVAATAVMKLVVQLP
jgi:beta-glucosidase